MNELEKAINKLAGGTTQIIVNPDTFKTMVEQGLPISQVEPAPVEEYVLKLIETKKEKALEVIKRLPPRRNFSLTSVNSLYDEIYECIIFGLNGAAITLCGILVEFVLKQALYFLENGRSFDYNPTLWDKFENTTLDPVIKHAKASNLIDDNMAIKLISFKETIRNPYNHYNIRRITKDVVAGNVKVLNIITREVKTVTLEAKDNPMIHAQAKRVYDKEMALPVLSFADTVVKYIFERLAT